MDNRSLDIAWVFTPLYNRYLLVAHTMPETKTARPRRRHSSLIRHLVTYDTQIPGSDLAWMHSRLFVPLTLLGLMLAMFAGELFLPGDRVLSELGMDTSNIFVYW